MSRSSAVDMRIRSNPEAAVINHVQRTDKTDVEIIYFGLGGTDRRLPADIHLDQVEAISLKTNYQILG